jgi:hypothetical protein
MVSRRIRRALTKKKLDAQIKEIAADLKRSDLSPKQFVFFHLHMSLAHALANFVEKPQTFNSATLRKYVHILETLHDDSIPDPPGKHRAALSLAYQYHLEGDPHVRV